MLADMPELVDWKPRLLRSLGLKVGPISISNFGWFVGPDPLLYQQWFLLLDLKYSDRRPFSRQNHF